MPVSTCVFDAYGTLFDVTAAARDAAADPAFPELETTWTQLAAQWRLKQLEYTWLRALSNRHTDFWQVTQDGLDWALEAAGLANRPALRKRLLDLYWQLAAYPEVAAMLDTLKEAGLNTAILSNGSPDMLNGAVQSAGIGSLLDDVLSVETVGIFKPAPEVYDLVGTRFGVQPDEVLFVSSNGWDAGCAADFGFTTAWVNRAGQPVDKLPGQPDFVLEDLTRIPEIALSR